MKRIISSAVSAIFLTAAIASNTIPSDSDAQSVAWDGTADCSWYNESETEFEISSAEELAGLAKLVNEGSQFSGCTINLTNDIYINVFEEVYDSDSGIITSVLTDTEWNPIGIETAFSGTFNGNGHIIHGLITEGEKNAGLFGIIDNAVIKNITLEEGSVSAYEKAGGICGYADSSQFINCINGTEVIINDAEDTVFAGGIAGHADNSFFRSCDNLQMIKANTVSGECYSGGIAGAAQSSEFFVCQNIDSRYTIARAVDGNAYAGGICGYGAGSAEQCRNDKLVGSVSEEGTAFTGGIIGFGEINISGNYTDINNCINYGGAVVSLSASGYAGGMCGSGCNITDSYNAGVVSAMNGSKESCIGGIAGSDASIKNCYSIGKVNHDLESEEEAEAAGIISGGLMGELLNGTIDNSYYYDEAALCAVGTDKSYAASKTAEELFSGEFSEQMGNAYYLAEERTPALKACDAMNFGDINSDGMIDSFDIVLMRKGLTEGFGSLSEKTASEVNKDYKVNSEDLSSVCDFVLGKRVEFSE